MGWLPSTPLRCVLGCHDTPFGLKAGTYFQRVTRSPKGQALSQSCTSDEPNRSSRRFYQTWSEVRKPESEGRRAFSMRSIAMIATHSLLRF